MFHDFHGNENYATAKIQVTATALFAAASASCKKAPCCVKSHDKTTQNIERHNYRHYWSCLVKRFQYWLSILSLLCGVGSLQLDIQRPVDMGTSAAETLFLAYISLASQPNTFPDSWCLLVIPFLSLKKLLSNRFRITSPQLCLELGLSFLPLGLEDSLGESVISVISVPCFCALCFLCLCNFCSTLITILQGNPACGL